MAYQKRYRRVIPMYPGVTPDEDVLLWLVRESFDRQAAADGLVLTEFGEVDNVDPADVPPQMDHSAMPPRIDKVRDAAVQKSTLRAFEGVGVRGESD